MGAGKKGAREGDTRGERDPGSLSRARSFFPPNTSKLLLRRFQARSQDFLRGNAIRRGDGPNEARGGIRLCETAFRAF